MSTNTGSGAGAAKRPYEEHAGGSSAGRGVGRPPGAPPTPSMSETLLAIQKQLTMQTDRMKLLADKSDVKAISDKVEALHCVPTSKLQRNARTTFQPSVMSSSLLTCPSFLLLIPSVLFQCKGRRSSSD